MRFYTGKCKCGSVVAGMVALPEHKKDTARNLKEWIDDDLIIESYEGERGPQLQRCVCPKEEQTINNPLFI